MKSEKRYSSYRFIIALCFLFMIFGVCFTVFMIQQSRQKNINYFNEIVKEKQMVLENQIKGNWEILDGVALAISSLEKTEASVLMPLLDEINRNNAFLCMGFIEAEGLAYLMDIDGSLCRDVDFSAEAFFEGAWSGRNTISEIRKDPFKERYVNYYGVPVKKNGTVIGVLCAADEAERINSLLDIPLINGEGYSNLIRRDGTDGIRTFYEADTENLRQIEAFHSAARADVLAAMEEGSEQFLEYRLGRSRFWAFCSPVKFNNWYLLSVVPQSAVNSDYYMILGVIGIIGFALLLFTFFTYCMNRMSAKSERQLRALAFEDPLLGIPNYTKFSRDLEKKISQGFQKEFCFWYGDIDDFKIFNESFGYAVGDEVLRSIAEQLSFMSEGEDTFCRVTADHFTGITYTVDREELIQRFRKLSAYLEHYEMPNRQSFRLLLSVGFYCVSGQEDLLTVNEMYNRAKMAQKSIKSLKNIKYAFYADSIREQIVLENDIESHMQQALEEEQFQVYIQPKVSIQNGCRIAGGEALVRWISPRKGMISPGSFIPLFEKNGFIIQLDRYMFRHTCQWLSRYLSEANPPIRIAVNVSRLGIYQEDFLEYYSGVKEEFGIPDDMVELEFTESMALEDNDLLRSRSLALRERGFICSLDDFGAGYSSLNTLKDLPMQVLKLDLLFFKKGTDEKRARIIVDNVVRMARQLDIRTVAEGVEEWQQVEFLKETGCDVIQGFVFAKPMPLSSFERLLQMEPSGRWNAEKLLEKL